MKSRKRNFDETTEIDRTIKVIRELSIKRPFHEFDFNLKFGSEWINEFKKYFE